MISEFFIGRPVFATVIALIITIAGAIALTQLPVARFPQIVPPTVVVSANFPGADASTIEQSVAAPIESAVNGVPHMIYMDSKSANDGTYQLTVSFEVGTPQDIAAVDVQNQIAVAQRQLPQDVLRQGITVVKRQPQSLVIIALEASDPRYDYLFLSNYATLHILDLLARIPGVGLVNIFGARDYGMRIWLKPDVMARLGVTTQDVAAVMQEQNVVAPAGVIGGEPAPNGQQLQYNVVVHGRLVKAEQFENIVVRSGADGAVVRLKDIARIELAATDYTRSTRLDGNPAILISINQLPDANALELAQRVFATMRQVSKSFPAGIKYSIPFDTTLFVDASLRELQITIGIAVVLVLLVVFVFLESWRATLIPMLAVPVAIIGSFTVFLLLGFSVNTLTLFAIVLAIGLVVDDAIVVVESVTQKMEQGLDPQAATRAAMKDVSGPITAIALVLIAVFVPVAFLGGLTGQFYRQFALTLSISSLISWIVALTFTPALCALLLKPAAQLTSHGVMGRFAAWFDHSFHRFTERYAAAVRSSIRRSGIVIGIFAAVLIATAWMAFTRPSGFIPDEDQGYLIALAQLPPGTSLQRTEAVAQQIRAAAAKMPEVDNVMAVSGLSFLTGTNNSYSATCFIILKPWDQRSAARSDATQIMKRLYAATAGIAEGNVLIVNPPAVPGLGQASGFEFVLENQSGNDIGELNAALREFMKEAATRPEIGRLSVFFNTDLPNLEYTVDRDRTKARGVQLSDVFGTLQTFLGGAYLNDFNLFGRTFRVTAQAEAEARASTDAVNGLYVRNAQGAMVPLSALLDAKLVKGPNYIERYNVLRAVTITGSAAPGYSADVAVRAMEEVAGHLPPGYGYEWSSAIYQQKLSGGQAPYVFAASLGFVFLVLAALYESWAIPLAVILAIPFAVFGAFAGLQVRGLDNNILAQVGLVMLIALAAKNAILIVEFAKVAHERGAPIVEAAVEGARLRLRPILMTSFAFIFASLPLAIASGAGAVARQVLGTVVVFGMTAATAFGILIIPVLYVLIQRMADHRKRTSVAPP